MKTTKTDWYIPEEEYFIGKYRAIMNKKTKELALSGKYGEIWEVGPQTCGAVIISNTVANKILGTDAKKGDEVIAEFDIADLDRWVKLLKIPTRQLKLQLKYANAFRG